MRSSVLPLAEPDDPVIDSFAACLKLGGLKIAYFSPGEAFLNESNCCDFDKTGKQDNELKELQTIDPRHWRALDSQLRLTDDSPHKQIHAGGFYREEIITDQLARTTLPAGKVGRLPEDTDRRGRALHLLRLTRLRCSA
jgi:hypothetical protein